MPKGIRAGQPTFWQVFGSGPRPALAIHPSLAHSGIWAPIAAALPDLTLTAFDLPGHGQSGPYDGATDYQKLSAQIAASFIDRPLDLIGHSFGATVALRLAVAAPEAIRTLTLIEPVLFVAAKGTDEWAAYTADEARFYALLDAGQHEAATREFVSRWGAGQPWDTLPAPVRATMIRQIQLIAAAGHANATDPGQILRDGGLEMIDAPVMLIEGAKSPPIIHMITKAIAARLPDVGVARVPGAGHMLPATHPAQVAGLIAVNLERAQ
ncbi:alpha/beta fold hydrolase [Phaeovulum sp.]|uniref:alpha/beta fold hydrolase n=1 Tax=Phaeovulum sp. TaxID=2934796 RepID=UPI0039E705E0